MNIDSLTLTSLSLSTSTTSSTKSSSTTASATSTRASSQPLSTPEYVAVVDVGIVGYPPLAATPFVRPTVSQSIPLFQKFYVVTYSLVVVSSFSMYFSSWIRKKYDHLTAYSSSLLWLLSYEWIQISNPADSMERSTTNQSLFIDIASIGIVAQGREHVVF